MRRYLRSERVKLPRVNRVASGRYKYHRVTGARLPADVPEDHPSFIAAWTTEEAHGRPQPTRSAPGSIAAAIGAFLASERYLALSSTYRAATRRHADAIAATYGTAPMRDLRARHIEADIAQLSANPARQRLKTWRLLCTFGRRSGLAATDAATGIRAPKAPKTDGHLPWTVDEITAFRAYWPVDQPRRLAFELLFWTGCRISDAVRLACGMVGNDGVLTFTQVKTGGPAHVPWICALPAFADAKSHGLLMDCIAAQHPRLLFIETRTGKPRSVKAIGNWISESARLAGVQKSAHGLRKSRLMQLAERGAPALALMSWGGHRTLSEVQHYIDAADRRQAIAGPEQGRNAANGPDPTAKSRLL